MWTPAGYQGRENLCQPILPFGPQPCLRKGPDSWESREELRKLIYQCQPWGPYPKQLSQKEHRSSHFLLGPQDSSCD